MRKRTKLRKLISICIILILLAGALCFGYYYLTTNYKVETVYVEGNTHYTQEEIKAMVMTGRYGDNSLYLAHKYKNRAIDDIPFVETMDVTVVSPDTIRITVYEKALAGYIEYLGRYVYFDKDGIVVEVADEKTDGIPEVIGVDFDYVVLYEQLPAEDEDLFKNVLNMTQLMTKYGVEAEKIYFSPTGEITLYHDDVRIKLGTDDDIDIKIMNLPSLLHNLEGMSGTLRMENYDEGTEKVSFEPDDAERKNNITDQLVDDGTSTETEEDAEAETETGAGTETDEENNTTDAGIEN